MPNLGASKYAPRTARTPAETLAESREKRLANDKEKATRLLSRLQWKGETLISSYNRAIELRQAEQGEELHSYGINERYAFAGGTAGRAASSHFRVDFFEYYSLLERYIVLCLGVMGVRVPETPADGMRAQNVNALKWVTNPSLHQTRPLATHAFHANLLAALDEAEGPLHTALGTQDVRIQLGMAKEFRNKWKDDSEKIVGANSGSTGYANGAGADSRALALEDLELYNMLKTILEGCERALNIILGKQNADPSSYTSRDFENMAYEEMEMAADDVPVDYIDDAMELD